MAQDICGEGRPKFRRQAVPIRLPAKLTKATEFCVGETVKGARNRAYHVTVISDAIMPMFEKKPQSKKLKEFEPSGATVFSTEAYLKK